MNQLGIAMNEYFMFALALSPLLLMVFLILKLKMPIHYSVLISLVFTAAGNILGNARTKSKSRDRLWRAEGIMADCDCDPRRYLQL